LHFRDVSPLDIFTWYKANKIGKILLINNLAFIEYAACLNQCRSWTKVYLKDKLDESAIKWFESNISAKVYAITNCSNFSLVFAFENEEEALHFKIVWI
jgi:hypothetical protein